LDFISYQTLFSLSLLVVHKPNGPTPNSAFDHSSVSATFKKMFSLPTFLTKRDEWAGTFEHIFSLTSPRTDAPTEVFFHFVLKKKQFLIFKF